MDYAGVKIFLLQLYEPLC